jgi:hypothetical protein
LLNKFDLSAVSTQIGIGILGVAFIVLGMWTAGGIDVARQDEADITESGKAEISKNKKVNLREMETRYSTAGVLYRSAAELYRTTSRSLRGADLGGAHLIETDLRGADLRGAYLYQANLYEVNLSEADLSGAIFGQTVLTNCTTLHEARGLEAVIHQEPSQLDDATLQANAAYLPDVFLAGVGYSREEIAQLRARYGKPADLHEPAVGSTDTNQTTDMYKVHEEQA